MRLRGYAKISAHSLRATGSTKLEISQQMAGIKPARTTGLYDGAAMKWPFDEAARIAS